MIKTPPYALPKRQKEALDYIVAHITEFDESPTLSEIAEGIGSNKQNVMVFVRELENAGHITRDKKKHRSIVVPWLGKEGE